ncbi:MAG: hypothetical protein DME76_17110, partial [Verrucomicrobia bacterium]
QYVKNFKGRTIWYGYRSEIDRYFMERFVNPNAAFQLKQNMPPLLKEIIDILATSNRAGRTNVASILLNISGEWRKIITSGVSDVLRRQSALRRAKPLSTHGDVKLTVFCWQKTVLKRDEEFALEHAKAAMLLANDNKRLLLELMFDASGKLSDVDYSFLRRDNIAAPDLERLEAFAESLRARRIEEAMQNRKRIGRNEYCPCGSGKKYKRCCIVRSRERSKVWPESVF